MNSLMKQILAVISMNIKSLPQRVWSSLTTMLSIAVVVGVLLAFLAMSDGFDKTLKGSGSNDVAIILNAGSQSELNSGLSGEVVKIVSNAPGIAKDENGPITSPELYVIVDGIKKSSLTEVNLPLRGIALAGLKLRKNVEIVKGRMFEPGKNELVVGTSILDQFSGFELGNEISLGGVQWTVVGVFDADGSVFGSEIWADYRAVQAQFNRGNSFQVVRVKLEIPGDLKAIEAFIKADPRLRLDISTEHQYFSEQSSGISALMYIGWGLAIFMAFGALAGALNTMYTSVAARSIEIATLRAIGFKGIAAFFGTMVESFILAFIGGIIGTIAVFILFDGITTSTMGANFSQIVFSFDLSMAAFLTGIKLALIIGLVGGFFPAWRASRIPVVVAFTTST